ncbi:MAG: sensor domain-containing diguanylate cyclase, partial [Thermomonas sp.]
SATATYRVRHADGHYVWLEAIARPLPGVNGGVILTSRDVTARIAAEQELAESRDALEKLVRIDSLTGLANRRQLDERLAIAITRARRHRQPLALMYLDIDHFKQVNDTLGHAAGDAVLRGFAQRLISNVRASDLVARLGGDEFVILVEDAGLPGSAEVIARKLIAAMAIPIDADGTPVASTTSIGIAFSSNAPDSEALMAGADAALYSAKDAGRNTYRMVTIDPPPA